MVHVYKWNLSHINYNIFSTFTATKLSLGTNNNMLNYRSAKNRGYLLNSTLFRNIFSTKMCIIWAVARNIHTKQIVILVTFPVLTIIDLSRTSILINQNYSQISVVQVKLCLKKQFLRKMSFLEPVYQCHVVRFNPRSQQCVQHCVVAENIQTPTMERISLRIPPTSLDFPFLLGTDGPPPPSGISSSMTKTPQPLWKSSFSKKKKEWLVRNGFHQKLVCFCFHLFG